jgi:hypothetical protein
MWRRNISIVIISSFVFLHTTIFVLSGIAFWKWIIVDIAFLLFIVLVDKSDQSNVFEQKTVIVVTLLIIFSPIIIQTAPLGWYTNNYDARYTIETVSESGEIQDVHWSEMDPYVYTFSSGRFEYIYNGQSISGVAQNWTMTNELRSSTSKEDVRSFKETYGENQYNQQNAQMFDCFMHQYFNTRLERQGNEVIWDKIPSVPHFWSTKSTRPLSSGKNITHVQIRRTEYIYTDKQIITVSSEVIREVNLTQPMSQCQLGDGL